MSGDRIETRHLHPIGILPQRPALAFRRVRQRVDGKAQSESRLGAFFVGHEVVDHEDAAGLQSGMGLGEELLIARGRFEATEVTGEHHIVVSGFDVLDRKVKELE